jgi:hypothetical protein
VILVTAADLTDAFRRICRTDSGFACDRAGASYVPFAAPSGLRQEKQMTKDEIVAWALASGWQMIDGYPSLTRPPKPSAPPIAIVRLVLKATVASLEIKKPAGKWEKVAGESYAKIEPDAETGIPGGLGLKTISGVTQLMQENKDRAVFGR